MRMFFHELRLSFRESNEVVTFQRVNFIWGQIGAGKSSIARLIDYCLGGALEETPALQDEFLDATLYLRIGDRDVSLYRARGTARVVATWEEGDEVHQLDLPARRGDEIVLPETEVKVLSDLIFHLAGVPIPSVRKGRKDGLQRMERLSFRDVYRFSYLDQDHIDSDFFRLDSTVDSFRRAKSVDSMRLFLGYYQDKVAALEAEVQRLSNLRLKAQSSASSLKDVLKEAELDDTVDIDVRIDALRNEAAAIRRTGLQLRDALAPSEDPHVVDILREEGRLLHLEITQVHERLEAVHQRRREADTLSNELKMLAIRYSRTKSAREVLAGVNFHSCPRCNQALPVRAFGDCTLCGQEESAQSHSGEHLDEEVLKNDLRVRMQELQETQAGLETQRRRLEDANLKLQSSKAKVDFSLAERLKEYDSVHMSRAVEIERQATITEQRAENLLGLKTFAEMVERYTEEAELLLERERATKNELTAARDEAFRDASSIENLERLFLDCLLRSRFPGVTQSHRVTIDRRTFWPEVTVIGEDDFAVTSFSNMGSGGMKCIFKACFAVALHRFAASREGVLPSVLVIDSAMKNLSERENAEIFESFYRMLYELAVSELKDTQFIFIDKEFLSPPAAYEEPLMSRHMVPGSLDHPALIPYYRVVGAQDDGQVPEETD